MQLKKVDSGRSRRLKPLALSVAMSCMFPVAAQAAILELFSSGNYQLGGNAPVALTSGPVTAGSVDVLSFPSSGSNQAGLHSYGSEAGDFGSRSSGAGVYDVNGLFRIRERLENNTAVDKNATFNFNITPGWLSNDLRSGFASTEFVDASIVFLIQVTHGASTTTAWTSFANLHSDSTGIGQFSSGGNDTGFYVPTSFGGGGVYYDVQNFSKTLDLGIVGAGEFIDISYQITTTAKGNSSGAGEITVPARTVEIPGYWFWTDSNFSTYGGPGQASNGECSGYGGYGDGFAPAVAGPGVGGADPSKPPTDSPCWKYRPGYTQVIPAYTVSDGVNGSQASSGDPFTLDFGNNPPGSPGYYSGLLPLQGGAQLTDIPEPGPMSLLALGLVGAWWTRRRRSS